MVHKQLKFTNFISAMDHKNGSFLPFLSSCPLPCFKVLTDFESEFECVTHFNQWDISKCHENRLEKHWHNWACLLLHLCHFVENAGASLLEFETHVK